MTTQAPANLWICVTCRRSLGADVAPGFATDGRELFDLTGLLLDEHAAAGLVRLRPVECMSGCTRSCTVALSAAGKASYMFGDLEPTPDTVEAILDCALLYAMRADGMLSRIDRPSALRKGILARIPAPPQEAR